MSTTSKVAATSAGPVNAVPNRVIGAGRAMSDRVDGAFGANGIFDPWQRPSGQQQQEGFGQFSQNRENNDPQTRYTPLILMSAASFPASESNPDSKYNRPIFMADQQRGVGVYEINMKVCSGVFFCQGNLVNRYS